MAAAEVCQQECVPAGPVESTLYHCVRKQERVHIDAQLSVPSLTV